MCSFSGRIICERNCNASVSLSLCFSAGEVDFEPFVLLEDFFHRESAVAQCGFAAEDAGQATVHRPPHRGILEPAGADFWWNAAMFRFAPLG